MPSKRARRRLGFPSSITTRGLDTFMAFKLTTVYRDHHQNFGGIDLLVQEGHKMGGTMPMLLIYQEIYLHGSTMASCFVHGCAEVNASTPLF
ncbi:uncharacterized protein LOC120270079 isoform X4 [Dioscorea cayenensis subsp. rotundata]|uniref:Uncharacterized protein LOC120270079 isoform X4 n=1 Tax=Dioscorea cayennensis subsp. rotundata TaxID=55577 RepID=A0AB40C330_DIOCR|nr:uncharacterized protein LOC120270079 isoform X4 [Dioscorea cayenensis subsp. rotundata]